MPVYETSIKNQATLIKNTVHGIGELTAERFVKRIPSFIEWLKESNLKYKLKERVSDTKKIIKDTSHVLYNKKVVLTGSRNEEVIEKLRKVGAILQTSPSADTFLVIAKNPEIITGKIKKAKELGLETSHIISNEQFIEQYK